MIWQTMDHDMRREMEVQLILNLNFEFDRGERIGGIDAGQDLEVSIVSHSWAYRPSEFSFGCAFGTILFLIEVTRDFAASNCEGMSVEVVAALIETMPSTDELVGSPRDQVIGSNFYLTEKEGSVFGREGSRNGGKS